MRYKLVIQREKVRKARHKLRYEIQTHNSEKVRKF